MDKLIITIAPTGSVPTKARNPHLPVTPEEIADTLLDTAGREISWDDFAGQRALLAFSSTHCPACAEVCPHLRAFSESRQDVQVVMISQGSVEENQQLVEEQGFGFPVLAWDDAVAGDYEVPGTPFFYVID